MLKDKNKAIIATIFAMILWGSAIPTIKNTYLAMNVLANDTGSQMLVAGIRFFLAGLLTFIYFKIFRKKSFSEVEYDLKYVIILSLIQTSIQYMIYYIALSNTAGVKASVIQATNAFIVVILSAILLPNEKIRPNTIIAIAIGTLGIVVVNGGLSAIKTQFVPTGDGFILLSTVFNALSTVFVRKYGKDEDQFFTTGFQFLLGALPLIVVGLMIKTNPISISPKAIALLAYGAFISATAYVIWNTVLSYHPANEMGMYKLLIPIFGSIFSVIFLGERFTINLLIGLILVLFGSLILNINTKTNKK